MFGLQTTVISLLVYFIVSLGIGKFVVYSLWLVVEPDIVSYDTDLKNKKVQDCKAIHKMLICVTKVQECNATVDYRMRQPE